MVNAAQVSIKSHPVYSVWFHPKETIRRIMPRILLNERPVIFVGMLNGVALVIGLIRPPDWSNWALLVLAGLFGGPAVGFILLWVGGSLIRWTGSWLGGQASALETLTALALSSIPRIVRLLAWLPLFLLYVFNGYTLDSLIAINVARVYTLVGLLMELWSLVIFLTAVSEVHRFSIARALVAWILSWLVIIGPCWAIQAIGVAAEGLRSFLAG